MLEIDSLANDQLNSRSYEIRETTSWRRLLCRASCMTTGIILGSFLSASASDQPIKQYLEMDLNQLMEVTITSVSKKEQTLAETAAAVFVITQEDIRKSGVTTIPAAIAMAPGVHVAQISSSKWSVSSRGFAGFTSNKLLVLIDGRSVYSPAFSGTFWDMQHTMLEDIDRIEVVRGPGGTIWGSNAVNGVINIITKKAEDTQGSLVRLGVGSHEKYTAAARVGGKLGEDASGRLYLTGNDRDSLTLSESGEDANDDWTNFQGGFRTDGALGSQTEWTLQGDVFKNDGSSTIFPYWNPSAPYLTSEETDFNSSGANISGKIVHQMGNDRKLSLHTYYDNSKRDEEPYNLEFNTFDINLQYETPLGKNHNLTLGTGYRNIDADFDQTFQLDIPDQNLDLYNAFIQDEISLFDDKIITTFGIKWEHNEFTGDEWQPSAKMLWKAMENQSIWASFSRAVRTPSLVENSGHLVVASFPTPWGTGTASLNGNEDFESEEVYAYEAGHRWQISTALSTDIAVFYNDYSDLYAIKPLDSTRTRYTFVNALDATSYGLEASIKWRPKENLSVDLTYSYLHFELDDDEDPVNLDLSSALYTTTSPTHQVGLRGSYDISKQWQVNVWFRYQDETETRSSVDFYQTEISVDEFYILDVNIIWKPKSNIEVMLAGQNLLEDEQQQYVAEQYAPPAGVSRGVYAKVTWSF